MCSQQMIDAKTELLVLQADEALNQKAGANQKHHRQSHLAGNQGMPQPLLATPGDVSSSVFFECLRRIYSQAGPRRKSSKKHAGQN
jgi:hypothetical protein